MFAQAELGYSPERVGGEMVAARSARARQAARRASATSGPRDRMTGWGPRMVRSSG
jgi:hypothetical protein